VRGMLRSEKQHRPGQKRSKPPVERKLGQELLERGEGVAVRISWGSENLQEFQSPSD